MQKLRKITIWTLCPFLILYILVGLAYQSSHNRSEIYPFSDWFLFSYVNTQGEAFDLKYSDKAGKTHYLLEQLTGKKQKELSSLLYKLSRSKERDYKKLLKESMDMSLINEFPGPFTLVRKRFDRLKYYQDKEIRSEDEITVIHFPTL